ncbi:EAL domain-containing protein [Maricaulis sp.]|uniref:putative bifunctional diguanylate cyclase/phosphodiesterase n=1 Tax=Maricaulis sp. TaxID=1486257 RepID=UPI002612652E|nr:EAL domain-containing protein [Maricaulis sp.]
MRKPLEKRLALYLSAAAILSLIASVLTIYFFVGTLNRNAAETDRRLITAGIEAAARQNEIWAADYGWWDEALLLFNAGSTEILSSAMASPFEDHSAFDLISLSEPGNDRSFGWRRDTGQKVHHSLLSAETLDSLRAGLQAGRERSEFIVSQFVDLDGQLYLFSVSTLGESDARGELDPQTAPIIVVGTRIDKEFVSALEQNFLIHDIRLVEEELRPVAGAVPLNNHLGEAVGEFVWTPSKPGIETLRVAMVPIVGYILVFMLAFHVMRRRVRRMARRSEANERRARRAAARDALTGLSNRQGFNQYIARPASRSAAQSGEAAVIYVDLNGFKAVNDKAGHQAGDIVLKTVANRFRKSMPAHVHIARIGGDEFACVVLGKDASERALELARTISEFLAEPVEAQGRNYDIGGAIGVSWSTLEQPRAFKELVEEADMAMYRAKAEQLDQPLTYDCSLGIEHNRRRDLEADMEAGLERNEFYVVYQPIVDANDGTIRSVEALARWEHPTRGAVPPDVFIPIAERSKLIQKLGDFVLDTVCQDFAACSEHTVSINLSPAQLNSADVCERYVAKLEAAGLSPELIEIELTEAVLVDDFERARERLLQFAAAGFRLNLDDFGTGFAGMGYLHQVPFNKIKIDKSFVRSIGKGDGSNKMLQAMSLLGDALQKDLVAEGVETEGQASLLRLLGFRYLQGWHFGRPLTASALRQHLRDHKRQAG